ncbi:deoxyribonuclease I [Streptococcus gallolyticus subsp. gallolyticus]|uniref:endonuclease III domain-containing protein n=2 Tax=Streptococcus gallolyticus TaxID=315405 RepID=UPI000201ADCB|nr:deoxyribonuclease I [Streptococcus gallolyticus]MCF1635509.1 deoxyribonuclease I [Streptococcus gallolyticus]MCY7178675.1 deoxyribonuclease I [Streptococcus gallolyticus subsp. gallolyticus]MCY7193257.1 deoxyribonuclease I [Streptococcus gallolyticus subsp. gallolyticus]MCY7202127.1 deoxyribonuclease I [Streptococcus gallolyticus subsp. gallolyticus]OAV81052.1 deoxyribonuclease I [Streptococcus gallolyticus subsp. gallolyticus]
MQLTLYNLYQKMLTHMGATNWWPADSKQQIIIEAILIQNTTELNATRASQLIKSVSNYDLQVLVDMPKENLEELVRPAGFMKNKSKAIQEVASWYLAHEENPAKIVQQYGSSLRKVLLSLHGVGPETADVLMAYIFDQPQFIADKYARTLFTQLGINDLTDYKSLAILLAELPQPFTFADAQEFHGLIDEFGKQYFHPVEDFQKSFLAGDQLILK